MKQLKQYSDLLIHLFKAILNCIIQSFPIKIIRLVLLIIFIIMGAWCNFDDFRILEWRPSTSTFMTYLVIIPIMLEIYGFAKEWSNAYLQSLEDDKKDEKIKFLKDTILAKDRSYLREQLADMFDALQYTMTERICVYALSDCKLHFECISRYSTSPKFNEYSERKEYPLNDGIIGKVWIDGMANGWIRDANIPVKGTNKRSQKIYYEYLLKVYNIIQTVAEKFRMNPVDIIAEVIRDHKNEPIAVIIFESTQNNKICENNIQNTYTNHKKNRIINTIENIKKPSNIEDGAVKENM